MYSTQELSWSYPWGACNNVAKKHLFWLYFSKPVAFVDRFRDSNYFLICWSSVNNNKIITKKIVKICHFLSSKSNSGKNEILENCFLTEIWIVLKEFIKFIEKTQIIIIVIIICCSWTMHAWILKLCCCCVVFCKRKVVISTAIITIIITISNIILNGRKTKMIMESYILFIPKMI